MKHKTPKAAHSVGDLVATEYGQAVITRRTYLCGRQGKGWFYRFTVSKGREPDCNVGGFASLFKTGAKHGDWEELIDTIGA